MQVLAAPPRLGALECVSLEVRWKRFSFNKHASWASSFIGDSGKSNASCYRQCSNAIRSSCWRVDCACYAVVLSLQCTGSDLAKLSLGWYGECSIDLIVHGGTKNFLS
jgi:hypothetical protein